MTQSLLGQEV